MLGTRLYSRTKPNCRIFGLIVSVSVVMPVGSIVVVRLVESVGTATAAVALIVSGRNHAIESCRSPKAEVDAARTMIGRTEERFGLRPVRLAADTAYGEFSRKGDTDCRR